MFSLIITVISIALVAALAVSSLYFGGDAFNAGSDKAKAATIVNQASQINGGNTLYRLDTGSYAATVATLVTEDYLGAAPTNDDATAGTEWALSDDEVTLPVGSDKVCEELATQGGGELDIAGGTGPSTKAEVAGQFGCFSDSGTNTFVFNPSS